MGYDLWVGGGLSTAPRLAERLGVFVAPDRVAEAWHGVAQIFRDYGYRRLRNKARLKFLLADWGTAKFREVLETEYLGSALPDGPAAPTPATPGDHVGVHRQRDGRHYVGVTPLVGRVSGTILTRLADLLEAHGSQRLRTTPHQKLVLLDIDDAELEPLIAGLDELGLSARPSLFRRSTIACTGIEFCKLAIVETKQTASDAVRELEQRLAGLEEQLPAPISLHVNGCPNSCARIQTADIGLKGQLLPDGDGGQTPGFQVHLGGGLASLRPRRGRPRPHGARPQGHRRRARRLRRARSCAASSRSATSRPMRPSRTGRTASTRRPCDERERGRGAAQPPSAASRSGAAASRDLPSALGSRDAR